MPEYEYRHVTFGQEESVWIPEDAIGVTTSTFGDFQGGINVHVRYLVPTEDGDQR